jgi:hypothetical protein
MSGYNFRKCTGLWCVSGSCCNLTVAAEVKSFQSAWILLWTKCLSEYLGFHLSVSFHQCSLLIHLSPMLYNLVLCNLHNSSPLFLCILYCDMFQPLYVAVFTQFLMIIDNVQYHSQFLKTNCELLSKCTVDIM